MNTSRCVFMNVWFDVIAPHTHLGGNNQQAKSYI